MDDTTSRPATRQAQRDIAAQRRVEVAKLLTSGKRQREMALDLGVSVGTINKDIKALRRQWAKETIQNVDGLMTDDLQRVHVALAAIWPDVEKGDVAAIDRAVSLLQLRARWLGYETIKLDLSSGGAQVKLVMVNMASEAERLAAAPEIVAQEPRRA